MTVISIRSVERATKRLVLGWACLAVALQAWLLLNSWPALPWWTLGAALTAGVGMAIDRRAIGIVLALAYVLPALISQLHGFMFAPFSLIWLAALLGAMLADTTRSSWHVPAPWRGALVYAAVAVTVGATVVIARELDGMPALLFDAGRMYWSGGDHPQFTIMWTLHVALTLVVGILWFDWLCGAQVNCERVVVPPLVVSALVMATVAVYQLFVDIAALNPTAFAPRGRATATMYDANVAGILLALWIGGIVLWADRLRGWRLYLGAAGAIVCWIGVWASGSKTALATAVLITLAAMLERLRPWSRRKVQWVAVLGCLTIGLASAAVMANRPPSRTGGAPTRLSSRTGNPLTRARRSFAIAGSPWAVVIELWNRNGYGAAAARMIAEHPVEGIGIGRFQSFVTAYPGARGRPLPPDNAQNWLRHQIAEVGFVGGLGWIAWTAVFAGVVFVPAATERRGTWIARTMLLAFGGISLFGVPGQDPVVTITFWTLAFWYIELRGRPPTRSAVRPGVWLCGALALLVFASWSIHTATGDLRPPTRARRAGAPFSYGFGPAAPDGPFGGYRDTRSRAAAILFPTDAWLAIDVGRETAGDAPLDVRVWSGDVVVLKAVLRTADPVTAYVRVGGLRAPMQLEVRGEVPGLPAIPISAADLGLRTRWRFIESPPPGAQGYAATTAP